MREDTVVIEHLGTNHADEVVSEAIPHNAVEPFTPGILEGALRSPGLITRLPTTNTEASAAKPALR